MRLIAPPPRPPALGRAPAPPLPPAPARPGARVWLARHARVASSWHDVAYGALDVPLSDEGVAQTAKLGEAFRGERVDLVLSSDLERARALGRAVAACTGAPLREEPGLREVHRGVFQGRHRDELIAHWHSQAEAFWRDPWRWSCEGGECDAELFARGWPALERGLGALDGGALVVCAHANIVRVLLGRALGLEPEDSFRLATAPAHVSLLVGAGDGWRLAAANVPAPGAPA